MSDIDAVAEAIWRADHLGNTSLPWPEFCGRPVLYRRMAQAAIDALQLTEETRYEPTPLELRLGIAGVDARLVSPWVRVEEQR